MSKKGILSIAAAALMMPSLFAHPASALDWGDGFTDGGYTYGDIYLGKSANIQGGQTAEDFSASKSLLQAIPGVSIAEEPEDVEVSWPDSASFRVVVNNPENIPLHYQWSISDGYQVIEPAGATDSEILIPSTYYGMSDYYFCCIISDDNGNKIFTRDAELTVAGETVQPGQSHQLLYIGEYAVRPGESFNLSEHNYGSGVVTFAENGTDITLNNVQMNNPNPIVDWSFAQTQGILLVNTAYKVPEPAEYDEATYTNLPTGYHINFVGDNNITSDFYDTVGAGNIFQTYFADADNPHKPTVYLEGNGSLTLNGGSYNYISDAHLNIGVDINANSNDATYYGDAFGIQAVDITVENGAALTLNNRSTALRAYAAGDTYGNLYIKDGAEINATIDPGVGSNKFTGNDFLTAEDKTVIGRATINLTGRTDPERFNPINEHQLHHFVGISGGEGIKIDGATIDIDIDVPEHPDGQYTANIMGIKSGKSSPSTDKTILSIANSDINIDLNAPTSIIVSGINVGDNSTINDSNIDIKTSGIGSVSGISAGSDLAIKDSNVDADVNSGGGYTDPDDGTIMDETYGVLSRKLDVDMTNDNYRVSAKVNRGTAFTVVTGEAVLDPDEARPSFNPDYTPTLFVLKGKAQIITPEGGVISSSTYTTNWSRYDYAAEAIYSLADTSTPALEAVIASASVTTPESASDSEADASSTLATPNTGISTMAGCTTAGICGGLIFLTIAFLLNRRWINKSA